MQSSTSCARLADNALGAVAQKRWDDRTDAADHPDRLSVPKSAPAGLVTIELVNRGNAFHEAQLIRLPNA